MKIYTKTGDKGETGLFGGKRVPKNSRRIMAYGNVDELNAALGVCRSHTADVFLEKILHQLQLDLFELGSDLANPGKKGAANVNGGSGKKTVSRITDAHVEQLEHWIDEIDAKVLPLKNFILPGGCLLASHLHLARTICRRAERSAVAFMQEEKLDDQALIYLNRLSDLLFMMARLANKLEGEEEEKWGNS